MSNMRCMFCTATAFNQNIASWNTASVSNMASVRPLFKPHCRHVRRAGHALMSPALLLPRRMASLPWSHSLPVGASASMLWRSLRLLPHRRAHDAVCMACGVACVLSLEKKARPVWPGRAPEAAKKNPAPDIGTWRTVIGTNSTDETNRASPGEAATRLGGRVSTRTGPGGLDVDAVPSIATPRPS